MRASRSVEGWLLDEEAEALVAATVHAGSERRERETTVVEVGSYCGKSTIVLGLAAKSLGVPTAVHAVDPFDGVVGAADGAVLGTAPTYRRFLDNIARAGLDDVVRAVRAASYDVAWSGPIDLLFIDRLHDYPNVARDFFHFAQFIDPGGLVAFHDDAPYYPGVRTFVDELCAEGEWEVLQQAFSAGATSPRRAR